MKLYNENATFFVPDGADKALSLSRTTDLCITAHQDDVEFWAFGAISACLKDESRYFTGVTVADGAGSPRSGKFASMTDEDMNSSSLATPRRQSRTAKTPLL